MPPPLSEVICATVESEAENVYMYNFVITFSKTFLPKPEAGQVSAPLDDSKLLFGLCLYVL